MIILLCLSFLIIWLIGLIGIIIEVKQYLKDQRETKQRLMKQGRWPW